MVITGVCFLILLDLICFPCVAAPKSERAAERALHWVELLLPLIAGC